MAGASRALPIVRPAASGASSPRLQENDIAGKKPSTGSDTPTNPASNKLCKNIAIFGSCKYEGRGCAFSHDVEGKRNNAATPASSRPSTPSSNLTASSMAFTPSAPVFTPSSAASTPTTSQASPLLRAPGSTCTPSSNLASLAASANVFVPKSSAKSGTATPKVEDTTPQQSTPRPEEGELNEEDEEDFDGLNPYASIQSPASTSGNLPALSSSYHSAHSGPSTAPQSAAPSVYDPSTPSFEPAYPVHGQARIPDEGHAGQQEAYGYDSYTGEAHHMHGSGVENPYLNGGMPGMELYSQTMHQPLHYHLYHPSLPHLTPTHLSQHAHLMQTFFMSPQLREELQRKQEACYPASMLAPNRDLMLNDRYWGLVPLDKNPPNARNETISSRLYGWRSWLWRCTNDRDGKLYAVRRMEGEFADVRLGRASSIPELPPVNLSTGYRLSSPESILLVEKWSHILHPNIVTVREAFTTRAFGDYSVCFVYDYHPLSSSLLEIHLTTPARGRELPPPIPERVLWSYLVQLSSAVRMVHKAGMAVRCLDPSKIIITGKNRLRINGVGILDVLAYDGGKNTASFQQEDLLSLGKLFLSLACRSLSAIHNIQQSLDMVVGRTYTSEFSNALLYLMSKPNPQRKSIDEFWTMISGHVDDDLRGALDQADLLEGDLMRELENGRLFRLMAKFGFINERPEYDHDPRWAETGDRYIIKLFRDYVFHQIDEHGRPVIDLSHVLTCLNKLDAGVDEQLVLVSRDEQSCLIVSYREIRACLENSFRELAR